MKYFVKEGEHYYRLRVLATHQRLDGKRQFYNLCECVCGNKCYRTSSQLVRGLLKSCGCGYRERQKKGNFIHGGTSRRNGKVTLTYLYGFWLRIRNRGISLAKEWRNSYPPFRDWVEENLGPRPAPGWRLERWDRKKGFEPGNLLWVTEKQQYALREGFMLAALKK